MDLGFPDYSFGLFVEDMGSSMSGTSSYYEQG